MVADLLTKGYDDNGIAIPMTWTAAHHRRFLPGVPLPAVEEYCSCGFPAQNPVQHVVKKIGRSDATNPGLILHIHSHNACVSDWGSEGSLLGSASRSVVASEECPINAWCLALTAAQLDVHFVQPASPRAKTPVPSAPAPSLELEKLSFVEQVAHARLKADRRVHPERKRVLMLKLQRLESQLASMQNGDL